MNLLLAYVFSAVGIFIPSKSIQWLCVMASIIIFVILTTHYQIGGDYKSLQLRADNTVTGGTYWNTDLVFEIFVYLSRLIGVDVPVIYSTFMLAILPYNLNKPAITLFALTISFYLLITGFQRQALAAMFLVRLLAFKPIKLKMFGFVISFLIHKSAALLSAVAIISFNFRSKFIAIASGIAIFLILITMEKVFKETFLNHYIQYYFTDQMQSSGAYFRAMVMLIVYIILCFNRNAERNPSSSMFEIIIVASILMILYGSTTAGDRMLIFSVAVLIFSRIVASSSELRLAIAAAPFLIMTMVWVYTSPQAQQNW